jgi:aryl-alcohol dehydrogenase-like predicted oxidoreductase
MVLPRSTNDQKLAGRATPQGTHRYAARFRATTAPGHFREIPGGLVMSSIGIGTYLGEPDEATDRGYTESVIAAVEGGFNVVDTAINYRFQRSERSIGAALKHLARAGYGREEIVLCTKAGFLTPDGEMPDDVEEYFAREYLEPEILRPEEIAAGCHCMAPRFLEDQLGRSLNNLGVANLDVFYLHNPETQIGEVPADEFRRRIRDAFEFLESVVAGGKIGAYGMATWNAFRENIQSPGFMSLGEIERIARDVAGPDHHFRFLQVPMNLAMPEALLRPNQTVDGKTLATVQAARILGITVVISASLLQGQLTRNLPAYMAQALRGENDAERALQFARSVPAVTTALVGMSRVEHVRANLRMVGIEPAGREEFLKLFEQKAQHL